MTQPIWFGAKPTELPHMDVGLGPHLGIELVEAGDDYLKGRMPVDERTVQPYGVLHGGASVALAETLASIASAATLDLRKQTAVGLEINANHLRGVRKGWVTGVARPIHLGRTTHVWEIRMFDEDAKPTCISRCTTAIVDRRPASAGQSHDARSHDARSQDARAKDSGGGEDDQSEGHPS